MADARHADAPQEGRRSEHSARCRKSCLRLLRPASSSRQPEEALPPLFACRCRHGRRRTVAEHRLARPQRLFTHAYLCSHAQNIILRRGERPPCLSRPTSRGRLSAAGRHDVFSYRASHAQLWRVAAIAPLLPFVDSPMARFDDAEIVAGRWVTRCRFSCLRFCQEMPRQPRSPGSFAQAFRDAHAFRQIALRRQGAPSRFQSRGGDYCRLLISRDARPSVADARYKCRAISRRFAK